MNVPEPGQNEKIHCSLLNFERWEPTTKRETLIAAGAKPLDAARMVPVRLYSAAFPGSYAAETVAWQ